MIAKFVKQNVKIYFQAVQRLIVKKFAIFAPHKSQDKYGNQYIRQYMKNTEA